MKISKNQLKKIVEEETRNVLQEGFGDWVGGLFGGDDEEEEEELDPAGQSEAVPGEDYNPNAPAYGGADYDATLDASRAEPAYEPEHGIGFTEAEPGADYNPADPAYAGSLGYWKPGMPKPKLPKGWRKLPYRDPRRKAYRDWYKHRTRGRRKDSDGDGVPDYKDAYPDNPMSWGGTDGLPPGIVADFNENKSNSTKKLLKQLVKEEVEKSLAIRPKKKSLISEQDGDGGVLDVVGRTRKRYMRARDQEKAQASLPDDYDTGGQSKAVPGQDYNPYDPAYAGSLGYWKPGMPKPKLPKNWRKLPYNHKERKAYRDYAKYMKKRRAARKAKGEKAKGEKLAARGTAVTPMGTSPQVSAQTRLARTKAIEKNGQGALALAQKKGDTAAAARIQQSINKNKANQQKAQQDIETTSSGGYRKAQKTQADVDKLIKQRDTKSLEMARDPKKRAAQEKDYEKAMARNKKAQAAAAGEKKPAAPTAAKAPGEADVRRFKRLLKTNPAGAVNRWRRKFPGVDYPVKITGK